MSNIDFTPTAYTVKDPGNGKLRRYEGENWNYAFKSAHRELEELVEKYPTMAQLVVPDHFVQEWCKAYDSSLYAGGGYNRFTSVFFELAERALAQAKLQ